MTTNFFRKIFVHPSFVSPLRLLWNNNKKRKEILCIHSENKYTDMWNREIEFISYHKKAMKVVFVMYNVGIIRQKFYVLKMLRLI